MSAWETIHYQRIVYLYTSSIALQRNNLQKLKFIHKFNLLSCNFLINEFLYSLIYLSYNQKKLCHCSLRLSNVNLITKTDSSNFALPMFIFHKTQRLSIAK